MNTPEHTRRPVVTASRTAGADPLTLAVGVHLVLVDTGSVLLGRRRNTSYANGLWHLPAGHMQTGEPVTGSMCREADEELGIRVREEDLVLVHTMHHLDPDDGRSRLQLFFRPTRYDGHVRNAEPHKCEELRWWPLDSLPADTVPYTVHALAEIGRGSTLSIVGWAA
ncbi:NUDIX hydrolase [Kitasatospora purpeofusca]|uniref:NUDIX hydrolase n=1 Tax=Kitasatospora purpeofusca TaxID=67352 RepID=UPI00224CA70F|nr:NUDIX domain-containing protein [Kitasatospora purpeofusca]MCX4758650.1 NUDIX domain-containing protein [Kitasatospora purpeofusca]WSR30915.1 NUDIX domain-containing protein [Kitasatospora purpeofusca]